MFLGDVDQAMSRMPGDSGVTTAPATPAKNIWHYCSILSEVGQVDIPLSTKKTGFQKKKKKMSQLFFGKKDVIL